jgi:hypothetical protein
MWFRAAAIAASTVSMGAVVAAPADAYRDYPPAKP